VKIYNSLSKQVEEFVPLTDNAVGMYVCGPTVYDRAHLGNARSAVVFDLVYRALANKYTSVNYVRNFTDVDDKINNSAKQQHPELDVVDAIRLITDSTIKMYHQDMDSLGVLRPTHEPRASDYIAEMQEMILLLLERNHAYVKDGSVFFAVNSVDDSLRGILSNRKFSGSTEFSRVTENKLKEHSDDFVLWKPSDATEPGWPSPWGLGRPGWHIECSAMSQKLLGKEFDIHGGGEDLLFPHHENEIAQSGSAHNHRPHARVWMHNGMVLINGKKMSKSLGNFLTVSDIADVMTGNEIRIAMLSTHYRAALNWNDNLILQSRNVWKKFAKVSPNDELPSSEFVQALYTDFNTPLAFSIIHKEIKENKPTAYPALKLLGLDPWQL
jgi:cysteinyl-tRNA synthetase